MISARPPRRGRASQKLKDAKRVVGAENGDRARQADALRARRRRAERDRGRGDGKVGPVVLAEPEHVEPDLVGELDLLEQVPQPLRRVGAGPSSANV
jgi:hypothetical protein